MVEEGDQLMAEALGAILAGQEEVHSKLLKVDKRSSGSQRKHPVSPAYVRLVRMALRMARNIREGRKVRQSVKHPGAPPGFLKTERAPAVGFFVAAPNTFL